MKKVFISQPMRGKTDEEILKEREKMINIAKKEIGEDIIILETFFKGADFEKKSPLYFLSKSIEKLSEADIAIFAPDWSTARGCIIEYDCCHSYGIEVIECNDKGVHDLW